MQQQTLIFLGPQGSGKGTQVGLLKEYLASDTSRGVFHYDSGAALRAFKETPGHTQQLVGEAMARGEIIADFLAVTLFGEALIKGIAGDEHMLFDGFPRTVSQAQIFETAMKFYGRSQVTIINLQLSEEHSIERLLKRGRHDDTEEGIRARLSWYREHVLPMLDYCRANTLYTVVDINANQTPEAVHADIVTALH